MNTISRCFLLDTDACLKNIFCSNLLQQQMLLNNSRNCRYSASCLVYSLYLWYSFFLLWAWSSALAMNLLHVNKNVCVFRLLSRNSEEWLEFALAPADFGENWACGICLGATERLELAPIFTQAVAVWCSTTYFCLGSTLLNCDGMIYMVLLCIPILFRTTVIMYI